MDETILPNVTIVFNKETPTPATVVADAAGYKDIIIGPAVGAACVLILIILLVVYWIKRRSSSTNLPPMLPHPDTIRRFYSEPPISDHQSDEQVTRRQDSKHSDSVQHIWAVQEPVIHSSSYSSESERISYMHMNSPDRPMSLSPPSPKQSARGSNTVSNNRPSPAVCKTQSGYINVPQKTQSPPSASATPPRTPSNFNINKIVVDEVSTNEHENNLEDYLNVQDIILSERNNTHNAIKNKEKPSYKSLLSPQLPDLLTSSRLDKNRHKVKGDKNHQKEAINHSDDGYPSDSETPDSPESCGSPTSYVNVDQYKKKSHVKESVIIDLSKSRFPELVINNNSTSENKTQRKPKPPSVQEKPKLSQQQQLTETNLGDTYKISADFYRADAANQRHLDQKHRKLSTPTISEEDFEVHTSRKASMPNPETAPHSNPTQFLTIGGIQKKHQLKSPGSKTNKISRSHSYQEEVGVYQNYMAFSKSESKLPQQSPVGSTPTQQIFKDIQSAATNDPDTAADFQVTKLPVNVSRTIEQSDKSTTSQSPKVSVGKPRTPLKDTKFRSTPNMSSTEELSEIRSKLRKVN